MIELQLHDAPNIYDGLGCTKNIKGIGGTALQKYNLNLQKYIYRYRCI